MLYLVFIPLFFVECASPLVRAADSGDIVALEKFRTTGTSLNEPDINNGLYLIHIAALALQQETIDYLLKHGSDINTEDKLGNHPLDLVVFSPPFRDQTRVKALTVFLLEKGANPSPALGPATFYGNQELVLLLIEKGADPNFQNKAGYAALHTMVTSVYANAELAKLLIKHGAKISLKNKAGKTPLMILQGRSMQDPELKKVLSEGN